MTEIAITAIWAVKAAMKQNIVVFVLLSLPVGAYSRDKKKRYVK